LGLVAAIETFYPDVSIIILDYFQFKLDLAKTIAKKCTTFNLSDKTVSSIADIIRKISGERNGADVFFECSGSPDSIKAGFEFIRKCGTFVHVGICKEIYVDAPWNVISAGKELTIVGCNLGRNAWPRAFEILKKCDLSPMITHTLPLEEYSNALGLINSGIKVVLDPTLPPSKKLLDASQSVLSINNNNEKSFTIKDSVALITGSSRGIGRAIAIALAREGAKVIIHGTNHDSPSYLNEGTTMTVLAQEISATTGNSSITPVWSDLSTKEGVQSVLNQIRCPIDILICCAGGNVGSSGVNTASGGKPSGDTCLTINDSDTKSVLNRNFLTTHLICQSIVPQMVQNHRGHVIMIGSTSALIGREKDGIYTVSKAAVHQYMKCLATEVRSSNVRVNCIAPGPTLTERYKRNIGTDQGIFLRPEHVANTVIQLLKMDFVHGQILCVDGAQKNLSS
jgi:3-oxoacyl-[acyl-carrier protein] reductase